MAGIFNRSSHITEKHIHAEKIMEKQHVNKPMQPFERLSCSDALDHALFGQ